MEKKKADKLAETQANASHNWLRENDPDLAQMVDAGMPMSEAWNEAMRRRQPQQGPEMPSSVQEYEYARNNGYQGSFMDWQTMDKGSGSRPALGTTIYTGRDAAGNLVPLQAGQGSFVQTQMPDGVRFDPGAMSGERARATVDEKTAGAARAALPGAQQMMDITNKAVQEVRNNAKGMNEWFGQIGPRGVYVNPGSEMGKFQAAAAPTNAQAFMQARNMLKGGGQITDYEGRRAEDAISRMQAALDKGDQDQYLRALADFEQAVAEGYQKLVTTAQSGYSQGGAAMPAALTSGNQTSTGVGGDPVAAAEALLNSGKY